MKRLNHIRERPRFDRSHWPQEWTSKWRLQVLDLFCGRGGAARALEKWLPERMYLGIDIEDYSEEYPGQFMQADLIDPNNRPFNDVVADVVWVSWPCQAYADPSAIQYGSAENALEQNPRITDEFREWLLSIAGHYIIENVPNASYYGNLDANVQINGLAFGDPYDNTRVFETTFDCPDAYLPGTPDVTMAVDGDQSIKGLAKAKGVPSSWGKQGVRSAIPWKYVAHLLHYCPAINYPLPKKAQHTIDELTGKPEPHSMFGTGNCGGHKCEGKCHGNHPTHTNSAGRNETIVREEGEDTIRHDNFSI